MTKVFKVNLTFTFTGHYWIVRFDNFDRIWMGVDCSGCKLLSSQRTGRELNYPRFNVFGHLALVCHVAGVVVLLLVIVEHLTGQASAVCDLHHLWASGR